MSTPTDPAPEVETPATDTAKDIHVNEPRGGLGCADWRDVRRVYDFVGTQERRAIAAERERDELLGLVYTQIGDMKETWANLAAARKMEIDGLRRKYMTEEWERKSYQAQISSLDSRIAAGETALAAAQQRCGELEYERDQAVKEANRRDAKWMEGIQEICGTSINFYPLGEPRSPHPTLDEFIQSLRASTGGEAS